MKYVLLSLLESYILGKKCFSGNIYDTSKIRPKKAESIRKANNSINICICKRQIKKNVNPWKAKSNDTRIYRSA